MKSIEIKIEELTEEFFKPYGDKVIEINPEKFNQLIKAISSGELKKRAVKLYYREACPVVHGVRSVTSDQALRILQSTTEVVQKLYALNKLVSFKRFGMKFT